MKAKKIREIIDLFSSLEFSGTDQTDGIVFSDVCPVCKVDKTGKFCGMVDVPKKKLKDGHYPDCGLMLMKKSLEIEEATRKEIEADMGAFAMKEIIKNDGNPFRR